MTRSPVHLTFRRASLAFAVACWVAWVQAGEASAGAVSIEGMVAPYGSKNELSLALGVQPVQCQIVPTSEPQKIELCEWRLGNRDNGWSEYASAIATDDRVGVICGFSLSTSTRISDTCTARARRSDREGLRNQNGHRKDKRRRKVEEERRKVARTAAASSVDSTLQFEALSRLVGELPRSCDSVGDEVVCVWGTNNRTPGHGSIAARFKGDYTKKMRLRCRFPADGSDRKPGSCSAESGN